MQILREILTCKKVKTPQDDVDNSPNAKRANLKLFRDKEFSNNREKMMEEVGIKQLQNIPPQKMLRKYCKKFILYLKSKNILL